MYYAIRPEPLPVVKEAGQIIRKTTWRCADRRHILAFMESGACYFVIDGKSILLEKGKVLFIPAETPYLRRPYENTVSTIFYLHFMTEAPIPSLTFPEMQEQVSLLYGGVKEDMTSYSDGRDEAQTLFLSEVMDYSQSFDKVSELLCGILKEGFDKAGAYGKLKSSLLFAELLTLLSLGVIEEAKVSHLAWNASYPVALQKALRYIQKHYKKKVAAEEVAKAAGVSSQHLIRLFRKHLNSTPVGYINRTKVLHAIDLLRNTKLSVKEIAYELGFEDPNYFSRLFKREEGMSPGDTRARICNYDRDRRPSPSKE
ncbi:MAG: helix-turn-helix transcriptional regulator [Clostridia bacterium]|nr:helix-turn-helix transcriptional regulator [Clostridia bacterium]MBO5754778.1 helix-turn-helix transcriptional regulator [Clostridia bacterium]MBO7171210.1 helix-turn-helix transcriptional regulator [Clostridia bacterium]